MIFTSLELPGAYLIEPEPRADNRGFFARLWDRDEFARAELNPQVVNVNLSYTHTRGTVRGMHFQKHPYAEVKLVRCVRGAIFDAIVDLRPDSPTYLRWIGVELSAENHRALYIPEGFGHGFQTLEDHSDVLYQVSQFYTPGAEGGVRYDDPAINVRWPLPIALISDKDRSWPDYSGPASLQATGN